MARSDHRHDSIYSICSCYPDSHEATLQAMSEIWTAPGLRRREAESVAIPLAARAAWSIGGSVGVVTTDAIGLLVRRLARPHASGGTVIERSVILAEGDDSGAILDWISEHDGIGDSTVAPVRSNGLHGLRESVRVDSAPARRFVLPAHAFKDLLSRFPDLSTIGIVKISEDSQT